MNFFKNIMILSGMVVIATACSKQIDLLPTDSIGQEQAFEKVTDLELGINGVYGTWEARRASYISTVIADEARQGVGAEYRSVGAILFRWEHTPDYDEFRDANPGCAWTNMYAVIDRVNRMLFYLDGVETTTPGEAALKERIKGEALALRGFAHFELLRWYGKKYQPDELGVPVILEFAPSPGTFKPARNKQSEVIASVDADLTQARNLIPAGFTDIGRVTRNAVIAMQARIALYTNNWDNVIARSSEAIAVQPLTPRSGYTALWTTRSLPNNQSTEVIWKLNISAANLGVAIGALYQDPNNAVQYSPAQKLMDTYDQVNDIRFPAFFRTTPRNLIAKYGAKPPANENFSYDIKVLRTSELYLARAEAYAEKDDLVNGAADLNALRAARITGYTDVAFASKAELMDAIMLERYKELCYEGHRYFDLKRKGLPIERLLSDVQGNQNLVKLEPSRPKYLLPVPQQEIFANPNIQQNVGY